MARGFFVLILSKRTIMQKLIESKRFWLSVASVLAVIFKDNINITEEQLQQIVLLVASWIVGDSLRSTKEKV